MARFLFVVCFGWTLLLTAPARGQQAAPATAGPVVQYEYATLLAINGGAAVLDYGQSREDEKLQLKQQPVTEQQLYAAAVRKLEKAMLALNYLNSHGWEYIGMSSRQRSTGSTTSGSFDIYSVTEYLLRRRKQ